MKTILLIDDDAVLLDAISQQLRSEEYEVLLAKSGMDAFTVLKNHSVQLIVLDLMMPGMDGQEFAYHLKTLGLSHIPVIIFSNATNTAFPEFVKEYLVKSETSLQTLSTVIHKYI